MISFHLLELEDAAARSEIDVPLWQKISHRREIRNFFIKGRLVVL